MNRSFVSLDAIVFDAGTQIRAAINETIVCEYAEQMTDGAQFPPIVLFHDGNQYYLGDGFHRAMAAKRNEFRDIAADVRPGTKTDALWFALGANKTNGQRMTTADKKHAIALALQAWPDRSQTQIAEQIGCTQQWVAQVRAQLKDTSTCNLPDRVTGKDGKSYPSARSNGVGIQKSVAAVKQRVDRIRLMAGEGHTTRQIASAVGLSEEGCRATMKREGIHVPADRVTRKTQRHDATRIVETIVMDAENLTADVGLIDFDAIDRDRLGDWIDALTIAKKSLTSFIGRLIEEHKNHVKRTEVA